MTKLIVLDTETTGLDSYTEEVFEIGAVEVGTDHEWRWTIQPSDAAVAGMHPKAVEVNRYHERTADPDWEWDAARRDDGQLAPGDIDAVLGQIHVVLSGAHVIGAVPDFDARFITELYRTHNVEPPRWHYHLIDVETLAVGWLAGRGLRVRPPWDSDALMALVDVEAPPGDQRHTAVGDARWAARVWHKIMVGDNNR